MCAPQASVRGQEKQGLSPRVLLEAGFVVMFLGFGVPISVRLGDGDPDCVPWHGRRFGRRPCLFRPARLDCRRRHRAGQEIFPGPLLFLNRRGVSLRCKAQTAHVAIDSR